MISHSFPNMNRVRIATLVILPSVIGVVFGWKLSQAPLIVSPELLPSENSWLGRKLKNSIDRKLSENNDSIALKYSGSFQQIDHVRNTQFFESLSKKVGGIYPRPLLFINKNKDELISFLYLGNCLCSYRSVIHGGTVSSIMLEAAEQLLCENTKNSKCYLKSISISFRKPSISDSIVRINCKLSKVRKELDHI